MTVFFWFTRFTLLSQFNVLPVRSAQCRWVYIGTTQRWQFVMISLLSDVFFSFCWIYIAELKGKVFMLSWFFFNMKTKFSSSNLKKNWSKMAKVFMLNTYLGTLMDIMKKIYWWHEETWCSSGWYTFIVAWLIKNLNWWQTLCKQFSCI